MKEDYLFNKLATLLLKLMITPAGLKKLPSKTSGWLILICLCFILTTKSAYAQEMDYASAEPYTSNAISISGLGSDTINSEALPEKKITFAPPSNNLCSTATSLPCATSNLAGTTVGVTGTAHGTACTMSNYGVWYTFAGDGNITTITSVSTGGFDHEMSISSGSCGSFTNITCQDIGGTNGSETYTFTSVIGINYYIYIAYYGTGTTTGTFTISRTCTTPPTPPSNYLCSTATALPCGTSNLAGTTVNTSGVIHGTACSMSNYGVWYTFAGDGNITTITSASTGGFDHEMSISSGSCGSFTNLSCQDIGGTNGSETYTFTSVIGINYYIYIAGYATGGTATGTFTISRTCTTPPAPPANYLCSTATALPCATTNLAGTTVNTPGVAHGTLCTMSNYGVWYTFTGNGGSTTISATGNSFDLEMSISSGSCGSFTNLTCQDVALGTGTETYTFTSVVGINYYVYIAYYGTTTTTGTFTISRTCVTPPTCFSPTLNATTGITTTTATINWSAPTPVPTVGYEYVVSTSNTTPAGAGTPTTALTANLTALTANTTYYVFVRSNCGSGDFSTWTSGTFTTGYCAAAGSASSTYYINNFSTSGGTTNIANTSGYTAGGYSLVAQAVSQINYGSVNFSVGFYDGFYSYGFNIWIDWNNDMDFSDAGELVYASGGYVYSATGTITVPGTAAVGDHRIRIRANYLSTNPPACGSMNNGETEDYTFTVLPPLPCAANPSNITVTVTSQTTATVNWTAPGSPPANGYQYYYSPSNTTPTAGQTPAGSTAAGVTTASLSGLTAATSYYIWVRSNCGGGLGQGVWIGPITFYQPNCAVGSGTGTNALACPYIISGGALTLPGVDPAPINACSASACVDLTSAFLPLGETTSYAVTSIPYNPPYQFGCLQNPVSVNIDDRWSPVINLPFDFCFYGNNYNQCLISSNGVLTFDLTNPAGGYSTWNFTNDLPSTNLFRNTVFGVYHDIDPSVGGEVGWELITLNSGCRALVASWSNVPMFDFNNVKYTGMMVLYENTNIIEIYIQEKKIDDNADLTTTWNDGNALVGLQDETATKFAVAPGRNTTSPNWTATNEAWRFTPSGNSITAIKWYEGVGTSGPVVGTTNNINVCPAATTTYTAEVSYTFCSGAIQKEYDQTTVTVTGSKTWNGSVSTDWMVDNNWTPVGIPNGSDCVIIPYIPSRDPIVSVTGNGLAGTLSVLNNATLTINADCAITVTDAVTVQPSGTFQILDNGSLVQINNTTNTGNIKSYRDASVRQLDYVYWSSPVGNFNVNNIAAPLTPGPIYTWNTTVVNPNGGQGNWQAAAGQTMLKGIGYIVRAPSTFSSTPATLNGLFTGVPFNGTFTVPIARGSDENTLNHYGTNGTQITNYSDNYNLLGNPYPSALRGSQFLFDNRTKLEGNIKLWTHGALPAVISSPFYNTFTYNYSAGDYLTWNFVGTVCCPIAADDLFIGTGQGFVVQMHDGPASTDVVTFNNNMRSASFSNNTFYRSANPNTSNSNNNTLLDIERHRIWLDIIDANSSSYRTLLGYVEGATMGKDNFFDANELIAGGMTIYSLIGTEALTIQGRALPFNQEDQVPLGVSIPANGSYKIGIGAIDGMFANPAQNIYLEDTVMGIIHNLRQEPYTFTATTGSYYDRFILRYTDGSLGVNQNEANGLAAYISHEKLFVSASQNIASIEVYDVSGKLVRTYLPKESSHQLTDDFPFANGVYLAKIKLENGLMYTNKLMN